jgi:hypothetical protein
MAKERKPESLSEDELAEANGEPLPDRQAMTVIRGVEPLPQPIVPMEPGPGEVVLDPPPSDV